MLFIDENSNSPDTTTRMDVFKSSKDVDKSLEYSNVWKTFKGTSFSDQSRISDFQYRLQWQRLRPPECSVTITKDCDHLNALGIYFYNMHVMLWVVVMSMCVCLYEYLSYTLVICKYVYLCRWTLTFTVITAIWKL